MALVNVYPVSALVEVILLTGDVTTPITWLPEFPAGSFEIVGETLCCTVGLPFTNGVEGFCANILNDIKNTKNTKNDTVLLFILQIFKV
jgi:hypothetical protein